MPTFLSSSKLAAPLLAACALLAGCTAPGNDAAEVPSAQTGEELGSKTFLQFLNRQPALAAGRYTLVAATAAAGSSGSYSLSVSFDDGRTQNFSGSWTASAGPVIGTAAQNPRHAIALDMPGGLRASLTSSVDTLLFLLDASGGIVAQDDNGGGGTNSLIVLAESKTDAASYANAYYATIDPLNQRDTLPKWQQRNGFDSGDDAFAVFVDTKDLGYGRNMHLKRGLDGTAAFYVDNYQIQNVPGQAYGPINLDAAVEEVRDFHIGTNALEYGPVDSNGDGLSDDLDGDGDITADRDDYFVRFYTFSPTPPYQRLLAVDMDNLGDKGMPIPCITCHGGRADPLLPNGKFPNSGDTRGHLQLIDVDTLVFSTRTDRTRAALEAGLKAFNAAVYESYEPDLAPRPGLWNSTMAREMVESWYGGAGLPNATFDDTYVPAGWMPDAGTGSPPAGSDALYRDVVADNCRTCHLLRGTQDNSEIDFTSFEKFIAHRAEIEPLVFDAGRMPLALIPYRNLFDSDGGLDQLASFLPGFTRTAADGSLLVAGRPIANAGPDRRAPSPVAVNGIASRSAVAYAWRVVSSPAGAVASLDRASAVRPLLSANADGVYELELVVTAANGSQGAPDRVRVTVDSTLLKPPAALTFTADIKPVLQGMQATCLNCHRAGGNGSVIPPLFYTDPAMGENRDLYDEVRARINFNDPEESPLLIKPSGRHHAGGQLEGFDLLGNRSNYDLFLAWILEGAPEGS